MAMIVAEIEVTLEVSAEVEIDHGEICGDPQIITVAGVPIPRGSYFYAVIMEKCRGDFEEVIADKLRSNISNKRQSRHTR